MGCGPWGREETDVTERLHFPFSLSCTGEGNDNPLQCSCLENPRDRGAYWAAVYGVTQSQTRLKRLCRSSSRALMSLCFHTINKEKNGNITKVCNVYYLEKVIKVLVIYTVISVLGIK